MLPSVKYQEDIGNLLKILLYFGYQEKQQQLQKQFEQIIEKIQNSLHLLVPIQQHQQQPQEQTEKIPISKESSQITKEEPQTSELLWKLTDWKLHLYDSN